MPRNTTIRELVGNNAYTEAVLYPERDGRREGQGRSPRQGRRGVWGFLGLLYGVWLLSGLWSRYGVWFLYGSWSRYIRGFSCGLGFTFKGYVFLCGSGVFPYMLRFLCGLFLYLLFYSPPLLFSSHYCSFGI